MISGSAAGLRSLTSISPSTVSAACVIGASTNASSSAAKPALIRDKERTNCTRLKGDIRMEIEKIIKQRRKPPEKYIIGAYVVAFCETTSLHTT